MEMEWWEICFIAVLIFMIFLFVNYLLKKINDARMEERLTRLLQKTSTSQGTQFQLETGIDLEATQIKKPLPVNNPGSAISLVFDKDDNINQDFRKRTKAWDLEDIKEITEKTDNATVKKSIEQNKENSKAPAVRSIVIKDSQDNCNIAKTILPSAPEISKTNKQNTEPIETMNDEQQVLDATKIIEEILSRMFAPCTCLSENPIKVEKISFHKNNIMTSEYNKKSTKATETISPVIETVDVSQNTEEILSQILLLESQSEKEKELEKRSDISTRAREPEKNGTEATNSVNEVFEISLPQNRSNEDLEEKNLEATITTTTANPQLQMLETLRVGNSKNNNILTLSIDDYKEESNTSMMELIMADIKEELLICKNALKSNNISQTTKPNSLNTSMKETNTRLHHSNPARNTNSQIICQSLECFSEENKLNPIQDFKDKKSQIKESFTVRDVMVTITSTVSEPQTSKLSERAGEKITQKISDTSSQKYQQRLKQFWELFFPKPSTS